MDKDIGTCINCGVCKKNCEFLAKYDITFVDLEMLEKLKYHCLLCGECTKCCSFGVDGRKIIEDMRKANCNFGAGYKSTLIEKKRYLFKNYKGVKNKKGGNYEIVLFPGCNFPSFYPETTKHIIEILKPFNVGVIFDCCGKPINELGLMEDSDKIIETLNNRLNKYGVKEIVVICPNCYHYLQGKTNRKITDIYQFLQKFDIISKVDLDAQVYLPCPEKRNGEILESIKAIVEPKDISEIKNVQCCGLGGGASVMEKEMPKLFTEKLKNQGCESVYCYCATCASVFYRNGIENTYHMLPVLLGKSEKPDIKKSLINRMKTTFTGLI